VSSIHRRPRGHPAVSNAVSLWVATAAQSLHAADGLRLAGCRITNAVKCVPRSKQAGAARNQTLQRLLENELDTMGEGTAVLGVGNIAHQAVYVLAFDLKKSQFRFRHGAASRASERIGAIRQLSLQPI